MFFIISKILYFLVYPLTWVFAVLAIAILCKKPSLRKKLIVTAFLLLYFFCNSFIVDEALRIWEVKTISKSEVLEPFEYGIVMGGMVSFDSEYDRVNFVRSIDRLMQALELYGQKKIKKILITSGAGSLNEPNMQEALIIKNYLIKTGFPEQDIITEAASRNTYENAFYTTKLLSQKKGKCLLITSAYHMRRSLACFNKTGLSVVPYVADRYSGPRKFYFNHLFIPNTGALESWNVLLHELIGYAAYKLQGYV